MKKILLVTNKTLNRAGIDRFDIGYWNIYVPLLQLGYQVYFYDTVNPLNKNFSNILEEFKPDLIFCCLTGDKNVTPYEPLEEIKNETASGRTLTFNWFCDDTWRFDSFSKNICNMFNYCSTPEPSYIEQYKNIGYNNIIMATWHTNTEIYPKTKFKNIDIGFCGHINNQRNVLLTRIKDSGIDVRNAYGSSYEDMLAFYSLSKIGINFSLNENGVHKKTQMKLRMFEVPAAGTMLLTEHHEGIDNFFDTTKEICTFKTPEEMISKIRYYLNNKNALNKITENGYNRVMKDHDSKIRLSNVLEQIK
jgi:spore maturation protein CgeB